ncbi:hypothetical protein SCORR_v1c06480 [Spiroplasma corruscae]|uniref:Transmembrane protein n=1 Tax=Spiroplasma corruscae TaxID=216934 RepID=A0A222EPI0_9MOLU|nr:hypothetical protein [Spiroplasma corruscae]ASP28420.1 hypothetical protein SCORR_v1c06480 [Spiroplasma corruscae]
MNKLKKTKKIFITLLMFFFITYFLSCITTKLVLFKEFYNYIFNFSLILFFLIIISFFAFIISEFSIIIKKMNDMRFDIEFKNMNKIMYFKNNLRTFMTFIKIALPIIILKIYFFFNSYNQDYKVELFATITFLIVLVVILSIIIFSLLVSMECMIRNYNVYNLDWSIFNQNDILYFDRYIVLIIDYDFNYSNQVFTENLLIFINRTKKEIDIITNIKQSIFLNVEKKATCPPISL